VPPERKWPRKWLRVIIDEDDEDNKAVVMEKKEKALAEHVACRPEDVGRTVDDFNWILRIILKDPGGRIMNRPLDGESQGEQ
jgi:hypothetical protein